MAFICETCGSPYEVLPGELELHEKIVSSFEIGRMDPPPYCPDCRLRRKMVWRNERFLYSRTCDLSGKKMLSVYPQDAPFPVYERNEWWGDKWDPLSYGRDYDFTKPFFEQFGELLKVVPRSALNSSNVENCDYTNFAFDCRNCYLTQCCYDSESLYYGYWLLNCKDCLDCSYCFESQRCIGCVDCNHSYNCRFCTLSHTSTDSAYLYDCRGCTNCFGCVGLRRKSFCLFNEQLTKEEYEKKMKEIDLQNPVHVQAVTERLKALRLKHPHLYSVQEKTEHCTGDYIFECKNCVNCYQIYRSLDCMYVQDSETKDALHCYHPGWSELTYETYSSVTQRSCAFANQCWTGNDIYYSDNCQNCSHVFGCISLKQSRYCILNKQYTKEEYLAMIPKIREHMQSTGEWGEFFPVELAPFPYNETMAQQDFPMTKAEVEKRGWRWSDDLSKTTGRQTKEWKDMPQDIADVSDDVTKEIFSCSRCAKNYKVIPQELTFLRDASLPLPRICQDCRYTERLKLRNPRKLWKRECSKCKKSLETTYAPDRPETIYCEDCYLKQVY